MLRSGISFKQAFLIVIGLHVLGFGLLSIYSSVNGYLAKQFREKNREVLLTRKASKPTDWPAGSNPKLKVVARPVVSQSIKPSVKQNNNSIKKDIKDMTTAEKYKEIDRLFKEIDKKYGLPQSST